MFLCKNALTGKTEVIGEAQVRAEIKKALGREQVEITVMRMQDGSAIFGDERDKTYRWVWTRDEWTARHLPPRLNLRDVEPADMRRSGMLEGA